MREIKFRAWTSYCKKMYYDIWFDHLEVFAYDPEDEFQSVIIGYRTDNIMLQHCEIMQFTGLHDCNNTLTDIYEGDIIDENGIVKGNIYESPQIFKKGIDFIIEGMGTSAWRNTESIAMGRGCKYSE